MAARKNWIAVACAAHARGLRRARPGLYAGVPWQERALRRVVPGDRVAYYSPTVTMGGTDKLQAFVSIGLVNPGEVYPCDMGGGFVPFRRDVAYVPAREAPFAPLLDSLEFVEDRSRWGYKFRFGLFAVSDVDMLRIAQAMQADCSLLFF